MIIIDKYNIIILTLCKYYGISYEELSLLFRNKDKKLLVLLLMKNFRCLEGNINVEELDFLNERNIKYNIKKAEEKLLINKEFREDYFELEEKIQKKIKNA